MHKTRPFWALLLHYVRCNFWNIFLPIHWWYWLVACKRIPVIMGATHKSPYEVSGTASCLITVLKEKRKEQKIMTQLLTSKKSDGALLLHTASLKWQYSSSQTPIWFFSYTSSKSRWNFQSFFLPNELQYVDNLSFKIWIKLNMRQSSSDI